MRLSTPKAVMASQPLSASAFTLFESQPSDDAPEVTVATVASETVGGVGDGNGLWQANAHLSREARALANYLLREMDFRFRAVNTSISALQENFKNHSEQMEGKSVIITSSIDALKENFQINTEQVEWQALMNNLHVTPPHDLQRDASQKQKPFHGNRASESTHSTADHDASGWLDQVRESMAEHGNHSRASHTSGTSDMVTASTPTASSQMGSRMVGKVSAKKKSGGMFGDSRATVKKHIDQQEYNVFELYHESGWAQWIAKSDAFDNTTLVAIFLNAIYIGYDSDNNFEENLLDADLQFQIMENLFCAFFSLEWLVRFCAFQFKCDCLKDTWFRFDTVLVVMMVVETWIFPVALSGGTGIPTGLIKLIRLLRIFRMTRLMRILPELIAMIKGVKVASRAVGSALLMLVALIYVFGIILFTILKTEEEALVAHRFRKLGVTMWTLLIDGVFLDGIGLLSRALMDSNQYFSTFLLLLFVLLSALTVMNMLIGVLCEVVSQVASAEKEDIAIRMVKDNLLELLRELDEDGSGELSRNEVLEALKFPDVIETFESLRVDVHYLMEHLDMFFEHGDLPIHRVLDMILMLRGDRAPTMKDLLHKDTFNRWKITKSFKTILDTVERDSFRARASVKSGCN